MTAQESEELEMMRGDAIGDTVYSERWVLRVLIRLSEITDEGWDSDLEQTVCALWDMTAERDVVLFLLKNDFYNLSCKIFRTVNNARCIEIIAGILGNMCCLEEARNLLAEHNASLLVINLITSEDSLVLVQVVRIINSCLWPLRRDDSDTATRPSTPTLSESEVSDSETEVKDSKTEPWLYMVNPHKEMILSQLTFFLSSSVNEELLCSTLELMDTLLAIPSLCLEPTAGSSAQLAAALAECLRQLLRTARVGDSISANRRLWRAVQVWVGLVGHVASCQVGRENLGASGDILTKCFTKLVLLLTTPEALKTQEPELATLCLCVLETLPQIQVSSPVLARLIGVLYQLEEDMENLIRDSEESLEVRNLLHRGLQFLKLRVDKSDDLTGLLQRLTDQHQAFVVAICQQDSLISDKVTRALLQIRTNGLVQ